MTEAAERLRVAFDTTLLSGRIGGSAVYAHSLVNALRQRDDVDVKVISSASAGALATARWMTSGARSRVRAVGADVLHCPAFLAPLSSPVPMLLTIHDLALGWMPQDHPFEWRMYYKFLVPRLARRATLVITDTETTRGEIVATFGVPAERVVAIYLGINQDFFAVPRRDRERDIASPLVVFPGPPIARKNLDLVLRAMAGAQPGSALRRARLAITGATRAAYPHYARKIAATGLDDRIEWAGVLAYQDLTDLYARADLLVYPSFFEGFGFPPLEAMAAGTPVVAANASCLPEVLDGGAVLVDPRDDAAFASAVESVLSDSKVRLLLAARGLERARQFTWSRCAEMTAAAYKGAARVSR